MTDMTTASSRDDLARSTLEGVRSVVSSDLAARIASVVCAILLWELLALGFERVPSLTAVVSVLVDEVASGEVYSAFGYTLQRFVVGVSISFVLGVVLGVLLGLSPLTRAVLGDIVVVSIVIPGVIWALLCILWFGFGSTAPVVAVILTTVPFIAVNVLQGVQGVPSDLVRMSRAYGVPLLRRVRHLVLPAVTDYLVAAVRFSIILGWNLVLLTEWFGGSAGVGFRTRYFYDISQIDGFVAWIFVFIGFIVLLDRLVVERGARYVLRWRRSATELPMGNV